MVTIEPLNHYKKISTLQGKLKKNQKISFKGVEKYMIRFPFSRMRVLD